MMMTVRRSLLIAALLLSACKKQAPPEAAGPVASGPTSTEQAPAHVKEMLANFHRVYFDFDQSSLNDESKEALASNAKIMAEHPEVKVQIQGHADERGTSDYNLALGQRRAQSVLDGLVNAGVAPSRMQLISYGEEIPLDPAHNDRAWSKNRRAEFVVTWGDKVGGTVK